MHVSHSWWVLKLRYRYLVHILAWGLVSIRVICHYCCIGIIETFDTLISSSFNFAAILVVIFLKLLVAFIHKSSQQTFQSFSFILYFTLAEVPLAEIKIVSIRIKPFICLLVRCLPRTCYSKGISSFIVFWSRGAHVCIFVKAWQRSPHWPASWFETHTDSYGGSLLRLHIHV